MILEHLIWRCHCKRCIIYSWTLDGTCSFYIGSSDGHHEVLLLPTKRCLSGHKKTHLWPPGIHCPPLIKFFCGTSTLMLVRGQFATCVFACTPNAFFSRHSSTTSSSAPQSVDTGLQVPPALLLVAGAAMSLATESVESRVVEPSASVADSSTAAAGSAAGSAAHPPSTSQADGQKVRTKPSHPEPLKKARQPRVLKTVTIAQMVEKYGKYGLYDNNGRL